MAVAGDGATVGPGAGAGAAEAAGADVVGVLAGFGAAIAPAEQAAIMAMAAIPPEMLRTVFSCLMSALFRLGGGQTSASPRESGCFESNLQAWMVSIG